MVQGRHFDHMPQGLARDRVHQVLFLERLTAGVGRVEDAQPGMPARAAVEHRLDGFPEDAFDAGGFVKQEEHVRLVATLETLAR